MKLPIIILTLLMSLPTVAQEKSAQSVSPTAYKQMARKDKGKLVDVRTPEEFNEGHLRKATNSDFRAGEFEKEMAEWDRSKTYYLYCASGNRSGQALRLMQEAGFKSVYNLGAYKELKAAGLKVKEEQPKK